MAIDLEDKTTNNNDLTNIGAAENTADTPFAASTITVDLESTESDYLYNSGDSTSLSITGDISIEFWLKLESLPSVGGVAYAIVGKWNATTQDSYLVYVNPDNKLYAIFSSNGQTTSYAQVLTNATLASGEWHHWAITMDVSLGNNGMIIYKDGSSEAITKQGAGSPTAIFNSTASFTIGAKYTSGTADWFTDGMIDEVRVWNVIRTQPEIAANYNQRLVGNETNLVAYYPFEPLSGRTNVASRTAAGARTNAGARNLVSTRTSL